MNNLLIKYILPVISYIFTLKYRIFNSGRIIFGKNFICNFRFKIKGNGRIIFGDNVNAWAHREWNEFHLLTRDCVIRVGDNARLNGAGIFARKSVSIGSECLLASTVIMDNDFHNHYKVDGDIPAEEVIIQDNVWLAGQSAVMKGVKIGKNSILGFRGVAFTDIPENSIAIGNPAKIVKRF